MIQAAESKTIEMYMEKEAARQQEILENRALDHTEDKEKPGKEAIPPEGQAGFLVEEDMEIDDFEIVNGRNDCTSTPCAVDLSNVVDMFNNTFFPCITGFTFH